MLRRAGCGYRCRGIRGSVLSKMDLGIIAIAQVKRVVDECDGCLGRHTGNTPKERTLHLAIKRRPRDIVFLDHMDELGSVRRHEEKHALPPLV
jgi:hypothetical protein